MLLNQSIASCVFSIGKDVMNYGDLHEFFLGWFYRVHCLLVSKVVQMNCFETWAYDLLT